jgi:hypothetical protein
VTLPGARVFPVALIGIYSDRSGTERVEVHLDRLTARLAKRRWEMQHYGGIVEMWEQQPCGTAQLLPENE